MKLLLHIISTIHRTFWRVGVLIILSAVLRLGVVPGSDLISMLFFYFILEAMHLYSEFKHPHPEILWISGPHAPYYFGGFMLFAITMWWIFAHDKMASLPWLGLTLAATLIAYLIRPRIKVPIPISK